MKRLLWSTPNDGRPVSVAGGVASDMDLAVAAHEQMRLVDNTNASHAALVDAYENWRRDIADGTGLEPPPNPMIADYSSVSPGASPFPNPIETLTMLRLNEGEIVDRQRLAFQQWVNDQAARLPAEAVRDWAQRDAAADALELARNADTELSDLMESRPGWDKYVPAFAGGAVGSLRDPLTIGSLALGGGPGAARTIGGRIMNTAFTEALVNGATEAAAQPIVQDWRQRAGLDSGFDVALANVAFAAGLGGVFGATMRGASEGVAALGARRQVTRQGAVLAANDPNLTQMAREALGGDYVVTAQMLAEIRATLPPEVRGALDAAEQLAEIERQRPENVAARRHEDLFNRAEIMAQRDQLPAAVLDDDVQINRIVNALAPTPDSVTGPAVRAELDADNFDRLISEMRGEIDAVTGAPLRPVSSFLRAIGGIDPASPIAKELQARGITSRILPGLFSRDGARVATAQGVMVQRSRKALDNIPISEAPEQLQMLGAIDDGNGYVREQVFIDALEAEAGARRPIDTATAEQRAYYERNGIDFDTMDPDEIRTRMAAIADAERRYQATEPDNGLGLSTSETVTLPPGLTRRAYTDQVVRDAVRLAGPGVGDDIIANAVNLHLFEREALPDAVEWALSDAAGVSRENPPMSLSALGSTPPALRSADRPGTNADDDFAAEMAVDLEALGEDFEIPFGDEIVSLARLRDDLDQVQWLERVVAACKV